MGDQPIAQEPPAIAGQGGQGMTGHRATRGPAHPRACRHGVMGRLVRDERSTSGPVRLAEGLWQVAGPDITHPWDAAAYLVSGRGHALVDCGSGLAGEALDTALLVCGITPGELV